MLILFVALSLIVGLLFGWSIRWLYAKFRLSSAEQEAKRLRHFAERESTARQKEILLEGREKLQDERREQERDVQQLKKEVERSRGLVLKREEGIDQKLTAIETARGQADSYNNKLQERARRLEQSERTLQERLEAVSQLSRDEAKRLIIESLENEARRESHSIIKKIEHETQQTAERNAREILVSSMQRVASEVNAETTIAAVQLPNEEMKGRIIGREGRNIRVFETLTGADLIIDDTPEVVLISCFDPVRKEVARRSLERLMQDGRIHPTRIEDVVSKVTSEVGQIIFETGEETLFDLGIQNMPNEAIKAVGRMQFRTSYGQNVLAHSCEVTRLAGILAAELDADREVVKRGAILHDVGKAIPSNGDSNHVELGVELAKRIGEDARVINSIAAHHGGVPHNCVESVIVQIADAISAARPGARREMLESYIKRLQNLEEIALQHDGVEKAFAIQAGRELRIMVNHELISDVEAEKIAKSIARNIEGQLRYPGKIKITLIRETRITEYAR